MITRIAIVLPCLLLAGCMTPEEQAIARQQQIEADNNTCRSYGLRPGSEAFGNCRLQLDLAREQRYYYDPYPYYPPMYGSFHYFSH